MSDPHAISTQQIAGTLKELFTVMRSYEAQRVTVANGSLASVNSLHKKIEADDRITVATRSKLKSAYEDAIKDTEKASQFFCRLNS